MNAISRSTFGALVVLAAGALTACATTGGAGTAGARPSATEAWPAAQYSVCSGGHASRFPEREEVGRVCRQTLSLRDVY